MKKLFYTILACLAIVALPSCNDKDDIRKDIDNLNQRLDVLAPQIENLNTQIDSYHAMVTGGIYISSYTVAANGDYVLKMSDGSKFTVYGGKASEEVPTVSIDADGYWCYTIKGETSFFYDAKNEKLSAKPTNGPEGVTPKVSVDENGYWIFSTDEGKTWELMGGEVANPTKRPGSVFSSVVPTKDGNAMVFTMSAGGDPVTVPLYTNMEMTFNYTTENKLTIAKGNTGTIQAVVKNVDVLVVEDTDFIVKVDDKGLVTVQVPDDAELGEEVVHFRIIDKNHYAKLVSLIVVVE